MKSKTGACGKPCAGPATGLLRARRFVVFVTLHFVAMHAALAAVERVEIGSDGWRLVGDLQIPDSAETVAAVLLLNKAAGDRSAYDELARRLADRGIASLALDLRGHGESVNLARFVAGEVPRSPLIWDAEADVLAAYRFLQQASRIDAHRIAIIGGVSIQVTSVCQPSVVGGLSASSTMVEQTGSLAP